MHVRDGTLQHQRAFNSEYRMQEHTAQPRAIDLGNAQERGCNPRRSEVHPIPRRAINNIPILDTIHLEINRQPIGKPGQIDFEIDNLRSLARSHSFSHLVPTRSESFSGERQATVATVLNSYRTAIVFASEARVTRGREVRLFQLLRY